MIELLQPLADSIPLAKALINAFPDAAVAVPTWTLGALGAMSVVQAAKTHRKKLGKPLDNMQIRALAFVVASHLTFLTALKLFGQPFDMALAHAILSGFMTPTIAAVLITFVRSRAPTLAEAVAKDPYETGAFDK